MKENMPAGVPLLLMYFKVVKYEGKTLVAMYITYRGSITMVLRLWEHFIHTYVITYDWGRVSCPTAWEDLQSCGCGVHRDEWLSNVWIKCLAPSNYFYKYSFTHWCLLQNALQFTSQEPVKIYVGTSLKKINRLSLKKYSTHHALETTRILPIHTIRT